MQTDLIYYPLPFYLITILSSLAFCPIAAYYSKHGQMAKIQPLFFLSLFIPCITALVMIFTLGGQEMIQDFWTRLTLINIPTNYLAFLILLMPLVILLATAISLLFGYSAEQFQVAKELSVMKGWGLLGILIPVLFAPLIEELGWRGYGVDSLGQYFNVFMTSLIFGSLWALWHLPLFFVKGYYQNQLWKLGKIYTINFFASVIVVAFLMNWVYYHTGRSIPAIILFHSMLNLSSILFRTEQPTKCIATLLLCAVLIITIFFDWTFYFSYEATNI